MQSPYLQQLFSYWRLSYTPAWLALSVRSMASLYNDSQFSTNMDAAVSRLFDSPSVKLEQAVDWLGERAKEEHFSLADIWGVLTSAGIMKQVPVQAQRQTMVHIILIWNSFLSLLYRLRLSVKSLVFHQMDLRCLSDEADRNATNPYPIYCAIEKHCFTQGPIEGTYIHKDMLD